jgi:YHS domain-containing protein
MEAAMPRKTRLITAVLAAVTLMFAGLAQADSPPISADDAGHAIRGYDPVAYFTDGQPKPGDAAYSHDWNGATWLFASAAHRDAFAADPERYAPQFGGYCAYAITKGNVVISNPNVWSIVDDKLYLNLGAAAQKRWQEDVPGNIARAAARWPSALKDKGRSEAIPDEGSDR